MLILGIETSCDDTCSGILKIKKSGNIEILANITYSQNEIHKEFGGVFPNVAIREHKKKIAQTILEALSKANLLEKRKKVKFPRKLRSKIEDILKNRNNNILLSTFQEISKYKKPKIDYLSVTIGPGLDPCLWVGVNFVKALSIYWNIPIIPVNHIEGHIFANFVSSNEKRKMKNEKLQQKIEFPAICLIVSGGHTQLILMENIGKYKIIGETRDDAAGECFDKIAKILGLGYPGGPVVATKAAKFQISNSKQIQNSKFKIKLPRPMMYQKNYAFSFSGLKTAVFYDFQSRTPEIQKNKKYIEEICYKAEKAIVEVLLYKTLKAAEEYNTKTIILGGGVSANDRLKREIKKEATIKKMAFFIPEKKLSADNAIMIALTAYYNINKATKEIEKIRANPNLRI